MRVAYLLFSTFAINVLCASLGAQHKHTKRQVGVFNWQSWITGAGGKVADPPGHVARKQVLKSEIPGARRIKIRSGPYNVPHMGKKSISGHSGMLENYADTAIEKPCSGDCVILRQVGGLEYPNGENANIDTGMWLHHMVQFNTGARRWDPVGYGRVCMPHLAIMSTPSKSERYYVTGNERNRIDYFQGDSLDVSDGTGYKLDEDDVFTYVIELMNMNMDDKIVYLTMTYDVLDGPLPTGWKETKSIYLDADSCRYSEVEPPKQSGDFTISSKPWTPNVEGKIIYAMGHLHDGGINLDIKANGTSSLCETTAVYAGSADYVFRGSVMGSDKIATEHISNMPGCEPNKFSVKHMKRDQSWAVNGYYDYSLREGNLEKGKQAEVMAISMVVVAVERDVQPIT